MSGTSVDVRVSDRSASVESFKVMDVLKRANELQAEGHKIIHCEVGQPETGAPATVAQAAVEALQEPQVMGYTDAFGLGPLRQKIADYYSSKYGVGDIPISRIVITTGSSGGFLLTFTACFDAGDVVAIASSGYPCYRNILSALGCELANVKINDEFKLTAKELTEEIQQRHEKGLKPLKGLILSSPSNPTGAMLVPDELQDLCDLCSRQGIQFLSDEIYHGISYGKPEATALQFAPDTALVINSFSKYYSMSGWRLGWLVIPEGLVEPINALQQNMFINAPTISQTAALKCWDAVTIEELEGHVLKYKASREVILEAFATGGYGMKIAPADGGFYVYVDLSDENAHSPTHGSVAMCKALLEEEHVAFTPGNDFEDPLTNLGDRRFRISYAGGIETAKEAMKRFSRFWPGWLERVKASKAAAEQ